MVLYIGSGTDVGLSIGLRGLGLYNARYYEEYIIDLGDLHLATVDNGAMFFHDTEDFSVYAGASGNTPFKIVFTDSGGLTAEAWCGEVGGGETLGDELVTNGDFEGVFTGGLAAGFTNISASVEQYTYDTTNDAQKVTGAGGARRVVQQLAASAGQLIKPSVDIKTLTATNLSARLWYGSESAWPPSYGKQITNALVSVADWATQTGAFTSVLSNPFLFLLSSISSDGATGEAVFDNLTAKAYTDIPATGLKLYSTKNGTTQSMGNTDAGFNPNAITKVDIYG